MGKMIKLGKKRSVNLTKTRVVDFSTYLGVVLAFLVVDAMLRGGMLSRSFSGQLIPICCYIVMAVSLNLTVGILGELSLGHAGFMSVGAFSGIVAAMSLQGSIPSEPARLPKPHWGEPPAAPVCTSSSISTAARRSPTWASRKTG